jgi:hypothetical protein
MWSLELAQARKRDQVLRKCLSMVRTRLRNQDQIQNEWSEVAPSEDLPETVRDCKVFLKEARKHVKDLVKTSYQTRDNERRKKIEELSTSALTTDREKARALRHMQKAEALNQLFGKLRRLRMTTERQGVTRIEIPTDLTMDPKVCNSWREINIPNEVLFHLRERNRKHFG